MRLLGLNFKSDNTIKSKAIKYFVKNILPDFEQNCLILIHIKTMKTYSVNCKKNTANKNCSVKKLNKIG